MTVQDAKAMLIFFKRLVKEDPERVERLEDVKKFGIQDEMNWITQRGEQEKEKELFARIVDDNREIVAEGEIERLKRWIERHVAELRFGVLPGHRDVARELVAELIHLAESNGIQVILYFHLETQKADIALMKEHGFNEVGRVKKYYRRENEYIDRVYLVKNL